MDLTKHYELAVELGQLEKTDKEYRFFYDETNNPKIFKLNEDGFNYDDSAYFILGGLVLEKENAHLVCIMGAGSVGAIGHSDLTGRCANR